MNIVLIVSDTLRWDHLGASGNRWIRTPNLEVAPIRWTMRRVV
jgi:arylsulfatase A-like enzyme